MPAPMAVAAPSCADQIIHPQRCSMDRLAVTSGMRFAALAKCAAAPMFSIAMLSLVSGCGQSTASLPAQLQAPPKQDPVKSETVELTRGQLSSIKVEIARAFSFPVEVEAAGSIAFSDELAEIQTESALLGAAATYDLTCKELARVRSLGTGNGIAQKDLEQAQSDEQTAEAAVKAARDAVRALGKTDAEIDAMISKGRIESQTIQTVRAPTAAKPASGAPFSRLIVISSIPPNA